MPTKTEDLQSKLEQITGQMSAIVEQEERSEAADANLKDLESQAKFLVDRLGEQQRIAEYVAANRKMASRSRVAEQVADHDPAGIGEIFTRSEAFAAYQRAPMGTSSKVVVPMDKLETRAPLTTTSGTGQPWVTPSRVNIAIPNRQTPLLNLSQRVTVSSNSVEWVTYPAAAPLAAVVAEGAQKPEATITASITTVTLDTIAHYAEATRQLVEDSTAARTFIEQELRRGVLDKIEATIAAALTGAALPTATGADLMAAIRIGAGNVQDAGFQPNAVALNPADWAALDIQVFGSTLLGPSMTGSYWGLTPVAAGAITAGTAYVGDFSAGLTYLERSGVSLYVTDSHGGNFTKNIFTFLAEARGKGVVTRAEAFAKVSVTP